MCEKNQIFQNFILILQTWNIIIMNILVSLKKFPYPEFFFAKAEKVKIFLHSKEKVEIAEDSSRPESILLEIRSSLSGNRKAYFQLCSKEQ